MVLEDHVSSGTLRISPSSKKTFEECALKWWWVKVQGVEDPGSEASLFGNRTHQLLEHWQAGTWWMPSDRKLLSEELCLSRVLDFLPHPSTWTSEVKVEGMCGALPYVGYIDVFGEGMLGDLKTSGNPARYLPGPGAQPLEWDPQMVFYAEAVRRNYPGHWGGKPARLEHYQVQRPDKGVFARHVVAHAPMSNLDANWAHFEIVSDRMAKAAKVTDPMELPFSTDQCWAYGKPCPAAHRCPRNPANVKGMPTVDNPFAGISDVTTNQGSTVRPATPQNNTTPPDAAPQAQQPETLMVELINWIHTKLRADGKVSITDVKTQRIAMGVEPTGLLDALAKAGITPEFGTKETKWRSPEGEKSAHFTYSEDLPLKTDDAPPPAEDPDPAPATPPPAEDPAPATPPPAEDPEPTTEAIPDFIHPINSLTRAGVWAVYGALGEDLATDGFASKSRIKRRIQENSAIRSVRTSMVLQFIALFEEQGLADPTDDEGLIRRPVASDLPAEKGEPTPEPDAVSGKHLVGEAEAPTPEVPESKGAVAQPTLLIGGFISGAYEEMFTSLHEMLAPYIAEVEAEGGQVDKTFTQPLPTYHMADFGKGEKRVHAKVRVALMQGKLKLPFYLQAFASDPMFSLIIPEVKGFYKKHGIVINAVR